MAEISSPANSPSPSPKSKASYKDMVMASEGFEGTQEDMGISILPESERVVLPEGERVNCDSQVPLDTNGTSSSPPVSCFGPWMLAKKPQRRATKPGSNGAMKDGGITGSKTNGSRFNILHMDTSENAEPSGTTPPSNNEMNSTDKTEQSSQQLQHNIVRVRDPKGGKNPQQHRLNKPKQLATVNKLGKDKSQEIVKSAHKVIIPETIVNTNSKEISNIIPKSILPVRNKPIPPRTQEQKQADHEFALQLIKKWGSPQELQIYKSIQAESVMHQDSLTTCLEPEPEPPDKEISASHMVIDENSNELNHAIMDSNISQEDREKGRKKERKKERSKEREIERGVVAGDGGRERRSCSRCCPTARRRFDGAVRASVGAARPSTAAELAVAHGSGFTEELRRLRTATTELRKLRMTETAEVQRRCTAEGAGKRFPVWRTP
ncbi:hypothetical protein SESBI_48970, partial [Sesbania bispinosa]